MKKNIIFFFAFCILLLMSTTQSFATDYSTINDESIKAFLTIFPEYENAIATMTENIDPSNPVAFALNHKEALTEKLLSILAEYDITLDDFSQLMQKITLGYTNLQMEHSGLPPAFMKQLTKMNNLSDEEKEVIKRNVIAITEALEK